jgi:hypothetical protein
MPSIEEEPVGYTAESAKKLIYNHQTNSYNLEESFNDPERRIIQNFFNYEDTGYSADQTINNKENFVDFSFCENNDNPPQIDESKTKIPNYDSPSKSIAKAYQQTNDSNFVVKKGRTASPSRQSEDPLETHYTSKTREMDSSERVPASNPDNSVSLPPTEMASLHSSPQRGGDTEYSPVQEKTSKVKMYKTTNESYYVVKEGKKNPEQSQPNQSFETTQTVALASLASERSNLNFNYNQIEETKLEALGSTKHLLSEESSVRLFDRNTFDIPSPIERQSDYTYDSEGITKIVNENLAFSQSGYSDRLSIVSTDKKRSPPKKI